MWKLAILTFLIFCSRATCDEAKKDDIQKFECHMTNLYGGPIKFGQDHWCFFEKLYINNEEKVIFNASDVNVASVDKVRFRECLMNDIPQSLFVTFVNLETLNLERNSLQEIKPGSFHNASNLRSLSLRNNELRILFKNSFDKADNLNNVDLSSNEIFEIDEKAFQGNEFILELMLHDNNLKYLHKDTFRNLKFLDLLTLNGNQLKFLPEGLFVSNNLLTTLNLSNNYLNGLPKSLFSYMKQLYNLNLKGNKCIEQEFLNVFMKTKAVEESLELCNRNYEVEKLDFIIEKNQGMIEIVHSYIRKVDKRLNRIELLFNALFKLILAEDNPEETKMLLSKMQSLLYSYENLV